MKSFFLSLAILAGSGGVLYAQDGAAPDLPEGPLIKPLAPEYSSWVVSYAYSKSGKDEPSRQKEFQDAVSRMAEGDAAMAQFLTEGKTVAARPQISQVSIAKTGNIRSEVVTYGSGEREESWEVEDFQIRKDPFSGKILLTSGVEPDGDRSDFPEFGWIAETNFKGLKDANGRRCLIFEAKVLRSMFARPREAQAAAGAEVTDEALVAATATVDLESRMPVSLQWEDQTRTYVFGSAPPAKLTLPSEFAKVIEASLRRARAATAPLSPP